MQVKLNHGFAFYFNLILKWVYAYHTKLSVLDNGKITRLISPACDTLHFDSIHNIIIYFLVFLPHGHDLIKILILDG